MLNLSEYQGFLYPLTRSDRVLCCQVGNFTDSQQLDLAVVTPWRLGLSRLSSQGGQTKLLALSPRLYLDAGLSTMLMLPRVGAQAMLLLVYCSPDNKEILLHVMSVVNNTWFTKLSLNVPVSDDSLSRKQVTCTVNDDGTVYGFIEGTEFAFNYLNDCGDGPDVQRGHLKRPWMNHRRDDELVQHACPVGGKMFLICYRDAQSKLKWEIIRFESLDGELTQVGLAHLKQFDELFSEYVPLALKWAGSDRILIASFKRDLFLDLFRITQGRSGAMTVGRGQRIPLPPNIIRFRQHPSPFLADLTLIRKEGQTSIYQLMIDSQRLIMTLQDDKLFHQKLLGGISTTSPAATYNWTTFESPRPDHTFLYNETDLLEVSFKDDTLPYPLLPTSHSRGHQKWATVTEDESGCHVITTAQMRQNLIDTACPGESRVEFSQVKPSGLEERKLVRSKSKPTSTSICDGVFSVSDSHTTVFYENREAGPVRMKTVPDGWTDEQTTLAITQSYQITAHAIYRRAQGNMLTTSAYKVTADGIRDKVHGSSKDNSKVIKYADCSGRFLALAICKGAVQNKKWIVHTCEFKKNKIIVLDTQLVLGELHAVSVSLEGRTAAAVDRRVEIWSPKTDKEPYDLRFELHSMTFAAGELVVGTKTGHIEIPGSNREPIDLGKNAPVVILSSKQILLAVCEHLLFKINGYESEIIAEVPGEEVQAAGILHSSESQVHLALLPSVKSSNDIRTYSLAFSSWNSLSPLASFTIRSPVLDLKRWKYLPRCGLAWLMTGGAVHFCNFRTNSADVAIRLESTEDCLVVPSPKGSFSLMGDTPLIALVQNLRKRTVRIEVISLDLKCSVSTHEHKLPRNIKSISTITDPRATDHRVRLKCLTSGGKIEDVDVEIHEDEYEILRVYARFSRSEFESTNTAIEKPLPPPKRPRHSYGLTGPTLSAMIYATDMVDLESSFQQLTVVDPCGDSSPITAKTWNGTYNVCPVEPYDNPKAPLVSNLLVSEDSDDILAEFNNLLKGGNLIAGLSMLDEVVRSDLRRKHGSVVPCFQSSHKLRPGIYLWLFFTDYPANDRHITYHKANLDPGLFEHIRRALLKLQGFKSREIDWSSLPTSSMNLTSGHHDQAFSGLFC